MALRPFNALRPFWALSPFMALSPLRALRPLRALSPFMAVSPRSWLGASTLLASSPQPIRPTMAPSATLIWMVRFPSSLIWISPLEAARPTARVPLALRHPIARVLPFVHKVSVRHGLTTKQ